MITAVLFALTLLKISHFELNQNPTFSYLIIGLNSSKFDFVYKTVDEAIVVIIIQSAQIPQKREIRWEKDKYFEKANFSEIVEGDKKSALISIQLKKDAKWHIAKSGSSIILFAGKDIPFTDKIDVEEYMRSSVETRNYGAIDILFDFSKSEDKEISAKALFYLAEMLFKMGMEAKEITTLLKSANYYSNAAKKFLEIGEIKDAAELKYKSSKVFRISGFYPEAKFQAESGLKYITSQEDGFLSSEEKQDLETKFLCSQSIALVGMNKAGEALNVLGGINYRKISEEAYDCYWSALGAIEFEKGDFEKSAEFISYASDNFIKYDPAILPRYVKALIRTKRGYLARKYIGFMINSHLQDLKPEALLLFSESLLQDGDETNSLKFLYRVMREYPGTKWEIKARLFGVSNREKYLNAIKKIPKNEIPQDDPISKTIPNIRFIVKKFLTPESQIALKEYLEIINNRIQKGEDVESDLNFLKEVIPTIKVLRIPPDLHIEISEAMYKILESLYHKGYKIRAFVFYSENKDMLPPIKDYSFIDLIQKEIGQSSDTQFELAQIEMLSDELKCNEAYERIRKLKNKIDPKDYSIGILKVALCFFRTKDPKFKEICEEEISELETICFPRESTNIEKLKNLLEEITEEYKETTKEVKEKLK